MISITAAASLSAAQVTLLSPEPRPYVGTVDCSFDRVLVGPSGTEVTIWPESKRSIIGTQRLIPPTEVIVGRLHDPQQQGRDRFHSYSGGGLRLYPVRWSASGDRLYIRVWEQRQRIVAFTADGAPAAEVAELDSSWSRIDLNAVSHGDVAALTEAETVARTRRIDFGALLRGSATLGRGLELLAARRSDLALVRLGPAGETDLGINSSQVEMLTAFADARDYRRGIGYFGAPIRGMRTYFPYQLPIVDLGSGRVAGAFGPTGLALRAPGRLGPSLDRFRRMMEERGLVLLDASYSDGALVLLARSGRADRRLFRLAGAGISERPLCAERAEPVRRGERPGLLPLEGAETPDQLSIRAAALDRQGREVMEPGSPIILRYSLGSGGARDAVVYFHGGPGASEWPNSSPPVRRMLGPGRDVIAVEYSGSQGGGLALTRRLARHGVRAVEEDLHAVARWLRRQPYRRVFVVGVSFGGVPAMIAVSRYPDLFAANFFVAPLLRYRHPDEWAAVGTSGLGPVMRDTQLARDHAYYGGPAGQVRFASQLQALLAGAPLGPAHRFYFGDADPVSKREDLPPQTTALITVWPGGHGPATSVAAVWDDILREMQRPAGIGSPIQVRRGRHAWAITDPAMSTF